MSRLVTIFGGSGFIGRYIARRLAKEGWRVRVATRDPNHALFVKPYGVVGQVEPVFCNVRDDASVAAVLHGADAVVNCVGSFDASGANNYGAIQVEAAGRVARFAAAANVGTLVHLSAIGADAGSASGYTRTKANGEEAVLAAFPGAMVLRPSVVFGTEDEFFNRFARMATLSPVIPLFGAETRFQPVWADDVAQAAVKGVLGEAQGIFELGGPQVQTFRELIGTVLSQIKRRKLVVNLPFWLGKAIAPVAHLGEFLSLGIVKAPITADQVEDLRNDNVVAEGAKGFAQLGIVPTAMEAVLPDYLWRFRPSGQYAAIKDSAKNLRKA
jgi:NADH dehydrogenase